MVREIEPNKKANIRIVNGVPVCLSCGEELEHKENPLEHECDK